jgi:hypothetical protein
MNHTFLFFFYYYCMISKGSLGYWMLASSWISLWRMSLSADQLASEPLAYRDKLARQPPSLIYYQLNQTCMILSISMKVLAWDSVPLSPPIVDYILNCKYVQFHYYYIECWVFIDSLANIYQINNGARAKSADCSFRTHPVSPKVGSKEKMWME